MSEENDTYARRWRVVGWIVALIAVVVVAGPQILNLIGE